MTSHEQLNHFEDGLDAKELQWMDDFFVDTDCKSIVGAGYSEGIIFRTVAGMNSTNVTILATNLTTPTAVLWGPQGPPVSFGLIGRFSRSWLVVAPRPVYRNVVHVSISFAPLLYPHSRCS